LCVGVCSWLSNCAVRGMAVCVCEYVCVARVCVFCVCVFVCVCVCGCQIVQSGVWLCVFVKMFVLLAKCAVRGMVARVCMWLAKCAVRGVAGRVTCSRRWRHREMARQAHAHAGDKAFSAPADSALGSLAPTCPRSKQFPCHRLFSKPAEEDK